MKSRIAIVVGGSGYIGSKLVEALAGGGDFQEILNLDIRPPASPQGRARFVQADVRSPLRLDPGGFDPAGSWIFNLAAACREPGFEPREYFDINVKGAEHVTALAAKLGIPNILFTSTMSTYGRMQDATPETAMQYPETPYGISKLVAEKIHLRWLAEDGARRLIMCRPGVIFGPGDRENVYRMITAIRKGYFFIPGDPGIVKGYGYVHGLLESFDFVRAREGERLIVYNYAERDCVSVGGMVREIKSFLGKGGPVPTIPMGLLLPLSIAVQAVFKLAGKRNPIHPVRVRKMAFPTNLKPQYLIDNGFRFKYDLPEALRDWKRRRPEDFP